MKTGAGVLALLAVGASAAGCQRHAAPARRTVKAPGAGPGTRPARAALRASLTALKEQYAPGERLFLLFRLTNVSKGADAQPVTVDGRLRFLVQVRVHVLERTGREVPYPGWEICGEMPPARREDFVSIPPRFTYGTEFSGEDWEVAVTEPGTYEVYASFGSGEDGASFGLRAWTGHLDANRVKITVAERQSEG